MDTQKESEGSGKKERWSGHQVAEALMSVGRNTTVGKDLRPTFYPNKAKSGPNSSGWSEREKEWASSRGSTNECGKKRDCEKKL